MAAALLDVLRSLWLPAAITSAVGTLFLIAFADAPAPGRGIGRLFWPVVVGAGACYASGGLALLARTGWRPAAIAYAVAAVPPVGVGLLLRRSA